MKRFNYLISGFVIVIFFSFIIFSFFYFYGKTSQKSKPIIKLEISELSEAPLSSGVLVSEKVQNPSNVVALEAEGGSFSDGAEILTPFPDFLSSDILPMLITDSDSGVVATNNISENMNDENILSDTSDELLKSSGISNVVAADDSINERLGQSKSIADNEDSATNIHRIWKVVGAKDESAIIYNNITGETRTVYVGDTISGIGKIKSIEAVNGKWTVIGSNKSIGQ